MHIQAISDPVEVLRKGGHGEEQQGLSHAEHCERQLLQEFANHNKEDEDEKASLSFEATSSVEGEDAYSVHDFSLEGNYSLKSSHDNNDDSSLFGVLLADLGLSEDEPPQENVVEQADASTNATNNGDETFALLQGATVSAVPPSLPFDHPETGAEAVVAEEDEEEDRTLAEMNHLAYRYAQKAAADHHTVGDQSTVSESVNDLQRSKFWYEKAACQGDTDAMFNLGFMYLNDIFREDDRNEQKEVNNGDANEEKNNHNIGKYWVQQAAAKGNQVAQRYLEDLDKKDCHEEKSLWAIDDKNSNGNALKQYSTAFTPAPVIHGTTESSSSGRGTKEIDEVAVGDSDDSPVGIIRPSNAVLADTAAGGSRTTRATFILKEVKHWYKENKSKFRKRKSDLYHKAESMFFERMQTEFGIGFPTAREDQLRTILIHCNKKTEESGRIAQEDCYRYPQDKEAKFGIAKLPEALQFYFESNDPPSLEKEVSKCRRKLEELDGLIPPPSPKRSRAAKISLEFCEALMHDAAQGDEVAKVALESFNFIPGFKKTMEAHEKAREKTVGSTHSGGRCNGVTNAKADLVINARRTLFGAIQKGNLQEVKRLLNMNPNLVSTTDSNNRSALQWAVKCGHLDMAQELVRRGA